MEARAKDSHQIRKHNHVFELRGQPDQIERILVDRDLVGEGRGIVTAQPGAAVRVHADAEVAHTSLQVGVTGDNGDGRVGIVVDLRGVGNRFIALIVQREEEDAGDERGGG